MTPAARNARGNEVHDANSDDAERWLPIKPALLNRLIDSLWRPFGGMTEERFVTGHWIDDDGTEYLDVCVKVSIECDRSRLSEAVQAVRRIGRRLGQKAMYFEVSGYDGVQILRIEQRPR